MHLVTFPGAPQVQSWAGVMGKAVGISLEWYKVKNLQRLPKLSALGFIVPLKSTKYEVYGDLITVYPKPYSIYLRWTIGLSPTLRSI